MSTANITHRSIWSLAWPLILANLSVPLTGIIDAFVLGQQPTPGSLASLVISTKIFEFSLFLFYFLSLATTTLVSKSFGQDKPLTARLWGLRSLTFGLCLGLLIVPLLALISPAWIKFLGGTPETYPDALTYIHIGLIGVPAQLMTQALLGWLFGAMKNQDVMGLSLLINLSNISLTYVLVMHYDLGIKGAAIGTVVGQWLGLCYGLYASKYLFKDIRQQFSNIFDFTGVKQLLSANRDLFLRSVCIMSFLQCITKMSASMGTFGIAAMGIIMTLVFASSYIQEAFVRVTEALIARVYDPQDTIHYTIVTSKIRLWVIGLIIFFIALFSIFADKFILAVTQDTSTQFLASSLVPYLLIYIALASWNYYYNAILIGLGAFTQLRDAYILSTLVFLITMWFYFYSEPNFQRLWITTYIFELTRIINLKLALYRKLREPLKRKDSELELPSLIP